ncbi:9655_t:CDS:2 [Entrophospora sp. SA101]|nr:9655_t:CDS:2 [Entrophospora sp. SA101]
MTRGLYYLSNDGNGKPSLRAFTSCDGTFPITFTKYTVTPDPVVLGESATTNIEGTNTETIETGTLFEFITSFEGEVKNTTTADFCTTLNLTCPYEAGTFTYTNTTVVPADPSTPKGQTIKLDIVINVIIYTFPSPSLVKRAFTPCEGTFPITFSKYEYTPDPITVGSPVTVTVEGASTIPIDPLAILRATVTIEGVNITADVPFCTTYNLQCPLAPGPFSYTNTTDIPTVTGGLSKTVVIDQILNVIAPDNVTTIGCVQGSISVYFP